MIDPNQAPRGVDPATTREEPAVTRREQTGRLERFALYTTNAVGSMGFFMLIFAWTIGWLAWNYFAPKSARFDPYPAFVLWLFLSNMIQLFLMPLIMIGQNIQSRASDKRAEADLAINRKAEEGVANLLAEIENVKRLLTEHIGAK